MIVSVTALGARDGDAAGAATKVVKYLEGQELTPAEQSAVDHFRQEMRRLNIEAVRRQMEEGLP